MVSLTHPVRSFKRTDLLSYSLLIMYSYPFSTSYLSSSYYYTTSVSSDCLLIVYSYTFITSGSSSSSYLDIVRISEFLDLMLGPTALDLS
jgi:hypothetical protein